ncbi:SNF2-related protein [Ideonella sp. YS5]|uniref:SNF2-related protein n=1 Tax=Ideonella sp. YS5 TaxID=3453714 RepID=UPI003EEBDFD3
MSDTELLEQTAAADGSETMPIADFVREYRASLVDAVRVQNPPIYDGQQDAAVNALLDDLARKPFVAQRDVVQAVCRLLVNSGAPSAVINAEMGTGKTMMAIATAWAMHHLGYPRTLVVCPPHLVYKWRREIKQTVPGATVWILNGPDTLKKLLQLRLVTGGPKSPEFFVMGRVRMRMGFNWAPVFVTRRLIDPGLTGPERLDRAAAPVAACPDCFEPITVPDTDGEDRWIAPEEAASRLNVRQMRCARCNAALWSLVRPGTMPKTRREILRDSITQLPTIGQKTADKLIDAFGEDMLGGMLEDNVYEFINLMNDEGELFFSDRQARRMERAMANMEFSFGHGGYQPTEFIKRYLPGGFFGLLVADEGHEFKNDGSAQGQAFGVLASQCRKTLLLTGTLMGGYADDLFYLLFRMNPKAMVQDGFRYQRGSLGSASWSFMRTHGVVKDIYKTTGGGEERSHRTAKGKSVTHREAKAPGFGPVGVMRYVLPCTAFLKLKDIGGNVLPPYKEFFTGVPMAPEQEAAYRSMANSLKDALRQALRVGDQSLLGVVLNALLAWPDCCFRPETVLHPHRKTLLASAPALFDELTPMPKECQLIELCRQAKQAGRRTLVYTVYTGARDTSARLKALLDGEGFKVAVLRATVEAAKREDWLMEQVDRNVDVIVTNPELVKTGLDMLEFPTIVFMQSGYNVYTLQQASRRSWRIGQKLNVDVHFIGYEGCAQMECLSLMAKKISVSQSTSGDMPDSGLDVLNQSGDSVEVALAKQLLQ